MRRIIRYDAYNSPYKQALCHVKAVDGKATNEAQGSNSTFTLKPRFASNQKLAVRLELIRIYSVLRSITPHQT